MRDVLEALARWSAGGHRAAIATVVEIHGSAPLPVGTVMAVRADGAACGAVSGGCVEQQVVEAGRSVAAGGAWQRLRFAPSGDPLTDTGLPCGGGIDVLVEAWRPTPGQQAFAAAVLGGGGAVLRSEVEPIALHIAPPQPRLVLIGAGPVASALAVQALALGRRVVVIDPREAFAGRSPAPAHVITRWPAEALAELPPLRPADAVVALSHHPALDDDALLAALRSEAGFIGALGSRRSHLERRARLADGGVPSADLDRITGPIGLDLGGWTPAEVALAVMAELVAVGHGRGGGRLVHGQGSIHHPAQEAGR